MNATDNLMLSVDDLAGQMTDEVLETLQARGAGPITVDAELATWRTLKRMLREHRQRKHRLLSTHSFFERGTREAAALVPVGA
jgi:hypothetical protein